ncbi:MAG TPA: response regulator [Acidobacteriaceae bacterium]|nr:response regulator [Acidobacteriaceae bacterium]
MTIRRPLVAVIDDDQSVRESLPDLLAVFGFAGRAFSSAKEFLASPEMSAAECAILDVAMPGMSGPDLRRELKMLRPQLPVIFITARSDVGLRSQLLELGAVACLFKPFSDAALLDALRAVFPE